MRIVLVQPQIHKGYRLNITLEPISVACLKSACLKAGFNETKLLLASDENPEVTAGRIANLKPDLVGISAMTFTYPLARQIAKRVKETTKAVTVLGGYHASMIPEQVISEGDFDYLVHGMGEVSFPMLVGALAGGPPSFATLSTIPGLVWKENGGLQINPPYFSENLDEFPFPDRSDYDLRSFREHCAEAWKKPRAIVIGSRGCPFSCFFCCSAKAFGKKHMKRSPTNLAEELYELRQKYNVNHFYFGDENLFLDREWFYSCAESWMSRVPDIRWFGFGMLRIMDDELIRSVAKSGAFRLGFGVERFDMADKMPDKLKSLEHAEYVIRTLRVNGVFSTIHFIIGFPDDSVEKLQKEWRKLRTFTADYLGLPLATPYPGTVFRKELEEKGMEMSRDWSRYDMDTPTIKLDQMRTEDLETIQSWLLKKYHFRWAYIKVVLWRIKEKPSRLITYFLLFAISVIHGHFRSRKWNE